MQCSPRGPLIFRYFRNIQQLATQISSPADISSSSSLHSANQFEAFIGGPGEPFCDASVVSESDRAVSEIVESVSADFVQKQIKAEEEAALGSNMTSSDCSEEIKKELETASD